MSLIKKEFYQNLLADINILDVMKGENPTQKGSQWFCKSPYNTEQTASCHINIKKNKFIDYSSGKSGNAITYLMDKKNLTFVEAVQELAKLANKDVEYESEEAAKAYAEKQVKKAELQPLLDAAHAAYQKALFSLPRNHAAWEEIFFRGYSEQDAKIKKLGFAPGNQTIYNIAKELGNVDGAIEISLLNEKNNDRDFNRLVYPLYNATDKLVGFATRNLDKDVKKSKFAKWINSKSSTLFDPSKFLYGLNNAFSSINKTNTVWIVEGYNDVEAFQDHEIPNTISPCGTKLMDTQIKEIAKYAKKVYLCLDDDKAGKAATIKDIEKFLQLNFSVFTCNLPEGHDPDSYVRELKQKDFRFQFTDEELKASFNKNSLLIQHFEDNGFIKTGFDELCDFYLKGKDSITNQEGAKDICYIIAKVKDLGFRENYKSTLATRSKIKASIINTWVKEFEQDALEAALAKNPDYNWPSALKDEPIEKHLPMIRKYNFFQAKNQIWMQINDEKPFRFKSVSNFSIEVIQHMHDENFPKKLIRVKNIYNNERIFDYRADALVATQDVRKMLANQGNFKWKGDADNLENLTDFLYDDMGDGEQITELGWHHDGFWCWNNIVTVPGKESIKIDENGVFQFNDKTYYVPSANKIYRKSSSKYVSQKKVIVQNAQQPLGTYLEQLYKVHREHAITGTMFMISTIFQDIVFKHYNFFPMVFLYGNAGTGKDELSYCLRSFFGFPQTPNPVGSNLSTSKSAVRVLAEFKNMLIQFSEYTPGNEKNDETFKEFWNKNGYKRGTIAQRYSTEEVPVDCSILFTSNQFPTNLALITRLLTEQMMKNKFTIEEGKEFEKLMDMTKPGISSYTVEILHLRGIVEESFKEKYQTFIQGLKQMTDFADLEGRIIQNIAVMGAFYDLLRDYIHFPFTRAEMISHFTQMAKHIRKKLQTSSLNAKFWDCFYSCVKNRMNGDYILKVGKDLKIDGDQMYFNYKAVYDKVSDIWFRKHNEIAPKNLTLLQVLKEDEAFVTYKDNGVVFTDIENPNEKLKTSALIYNMNKIDVGRDILNAANWQIEESKSKQNSLENASPPHSPKDVDNKENQLAISAVNNIPEDDDLPF